MTDPTDITPDLFAAIEQRLATHAPELELYDAHLVGPATVRVLIDHPGGIDHGHCTEAARALDDYAERYRLEVSSIGLPRPLRRLEHYRRARGERAELTLHALLDGRRKLSGVIAEVTDDSIQLNLPDGETFTVPLAAVRKAHLHHELLIPAAPRPGRTNRS